MKRIVWLASYPKSGNTWFRAFLANFLADAEEPVSINQLKVGQIASARGALDAELGYDSANLSHDEIDLLRREWYLSMGRSSGGAVYIKVHDAYATLPNGMALFPPEVSKAVIYIVRNPLDVCVSYAHHTGQDAYRSTVAAMCNPRFTICGRPTCCHEQLRQRIGSWSKHVESWLNAPHHQVHVIRYEDMKSSPEEIFRRVANVLELPADDARLRKAIEFSSFDRLRGQEQQHGFRERPHPNRQFFRKGQTAAWRGALSNEEAGKLVEVHASVMAQLGYPTETK